MLDKVPDPNETQRACRVLPRRMPVCARPKLCSNLRIVETRDGALQYRRSDCAAASSRASRGVIAIGNAGKQASGRADERTTKALCAVLSCLARAH